MLIVAVLWLITFVLCASLMFLIGWIVGTLQISIPYRLSDAPKIVFQFRKQNVVWMIIFAVLSVAYLASGALVSNFIENMTTFLNTCFSSDLSDDLTRVLFFGNSLFLFFGLSTGIVLGKRIACRWSVRTRTVKFFDLVPWVGGK